ncbi:hypothetical protein GCM10012284_10560 [Mangrovihabitans endophyticus]|uniref:RmlD-like substrate binding domain-containing protein n=1 Tax=Mangrovihabitans endophyticus TaxID=1751298 RepID=A0A8J3BXZ8_9ACTN|nr:hypothetical protein GCM10012284_10560 [Mangrovihabitans endophyticus]
MFRLAGADLARVRPTSAAAYGHPVPLPDYSALAHDRWREIGAAPPRHWRPALREAMESFAEQMPGWTRDRS